MTQASLCGFALFAVLPARSEGLHASSASLCDVDMYVLRIAFSPHLKTSAPERKSELHTKFGIMRGVDVLCQGMRVPAVCARMFSKRKIRRTRQKAETACNPKMTRALTDRT